MKFLVGTYLIKARYSSFITKWRRILTTPIRIKGYATTPPNGFTTDQEAAPGKQGPDDVDYRPTKTHNALVTIPQNQLFSLLQVLSYWWIA
jgi:hypothetical protein